MSAEIEVPPRRCPACLKKHATATAVGGYVQRPSEGDWSICFNCGTTLRFGPGLTLRAATAAEVLAAPAETKVDLLLATRAVFILGHRRRLN